MLNFPANPTLNQTYQSGSSSTYLWNGDYWQVNLPPTQTVLNSINATSATTATTAIQARTTSGTTDTTTWIPLVGNNTTGGQSLVLDTELSYNAVTHVLNTTASLASSLVGSVPTYIQATKGSNQTIPTGAQLTVITNWGNTIAQNAGEFNQTTGVFTATKAGWYIASATLTYSSIIDTVNAEYSAGIAKNGAIIANNRYFVPLTQTLASFKQVATSPIIVQLAVNDTMTVVAQQFSGSGRTLHTNGNYVSIQELPSRIQR